MWSLGLDLTALIAAPGTLATRAAPAAPRRFPALDPLCFDRWRRSYLVERIAHLRAALSPSWHNGAERLPRILVRDLRPIDWLFLSAQGKKTRGQARRSLTAAFGPPSRDLAGAPPKAASLLTSRCFDSARSTDPGRREAPSFPLDPRTYVRDNSVCAFNRRLHADLPPDLWEASRNLCGRTPPPVARLWKGFHFQNTARLRLATLFQYLRSIRSGSSRSRLVPRHETIAAVV